MDPNVTFTAVRTSKLIVLYIMFAVLYSLNEGKSSCGGLPVADAALPREVLFQRGKF